MRIACVQTDVVFGQPMANAKALVRKLIELKSASVDLAVFPEAFLTGYCVNTAKEAEQISIHANADENHEILTADGSISVIQGMTDQLDIGCVVGFAGNKGFGHLNENLPCELYNGAILFEPGKTPRRYIKTHLPFLGYDRFAEPGTALDVFNTKWGKIGILICFDQRPPEAARTLALKGAELIVLPTNWPIGAEVSAEHMSIARAAENKVFMATCNRVGTENGTTFIGRSKIIDTRGRVLESAGDGEEILISDIDLQEAREKRIVNIPGEYEMEVFKSRQPNLYKIIGKTVQ
ncbi:MAG: carbon-nitrogen hydrolase family protein [Chlorobia bacterium]|nr:carbon-nitrogen hydrolase family protein [Fimbriimonadaceae bacterium]